VKGRRLVFSDASIADILEQADWYAAQSGPPLARRWEKAVTTAISHLLTRPARARPANSDRQHFAMQEEQQSQDFPKHLLFYRFDDDEVFVLRVGHGARDLERLFS